MRRRPPSPRALTRSLPWYALAALITVTLYWNFDAHVEAHGEPGVDLMACAATELLRGCAAGRGVGLFCKDTVY